MTLNPLDRLYGNGETRPSVTPDIVTGRDPGLMKESVMTRPLSKVRLLTLRTVVRFGRPASAYEVGVFTPRVPTTARAQEILAALVEGGMIIRDGENYSPTEYGMASAA